MQNDSTFYILIYNNIYISRQPNITGDNFVSFQNIKNGYFLRHKHGLLTEEEFDSSEIFSYDSTFVAHFQDRKLYLSCSNKNLLTYYVYLNSETDSFRIAKDDKYAFNIYTNPKDIHKSDITIEDIKNIKQTNKSLYKKITDINTELKTITSHINIFSDITKIPKAKGILRIFQEAEINFLQIIVDLIEKHGLKYWLFGGTLLGSYRHQDFIPWDDDIDIAMPREDYDQLAIVLTEEFLDMQGYYFTLGDGIRIFYEDTPLQIDIFPFDTTSYIENDKERNILRKTVLDCARTLKYDWTRCRTGSTIVNKTRADLKILYSKICSSIPKSEKKMFVQGFECCTRRRVCIFDYDWIFPLQKGNFSTHQFNIPAYPELILVENFGDFMKLPTTITYHKNINGFTAKQIWKMLKFQENREKK